MTPTVASGMVLAAWALTGKSSFGSVARVTPFHAAPAASSRRRGTIRASEEASKDWAQVLEIQQVLSGYFRALDERNFDVAHLQRLFTPDAKVVRPNGAETVGRAARLVRNSSSAPAVTGIDIAASVATIEVTSSTLKPRA